MFQLKNYVLEIWRTGSFSQAAANLYVSQPSLSASIKRLEKKIGEPLFDRSTHPVQLTQCGEAYVRSAQAISMAEDDFRSFVEDYSNCNAGTLVLGGSNMNISFVLPPLIKAFQKAYPQIELQLYEGNINDLQQQLMEGKIDIVIDSCDMDAERFDTYLYKSETLLLSIPREFSCNEDLIDYQMTRKDILQDKHLQDTQPVLPLHKIKQIPFVFLTPETDTYKRSWNLCQKAGFTPKVVLSFHQQATVFHTNCAGVGAAFISDILVKNANASADMCYYKLDSDECLRYIKFFKKKEKRMTRAMQAFLEIVQI